MALGYSAQLPLQLGANNGFELLQDLKQVVLQDLKMVVLTSPGERIMDPEFGVGLKNFLFEQDNHSTYSQIKARIMNQVRTYLPFVDIEDITFDSQGTGNTSIQSNAVSIKIFFFITPLGTGDLLELNI